MVHFVVPCVFQPISEIIHFKPTFLRAILHILRPSKYFCGVCCVFSVTPSPNTALYQQILHQTIDSAPTKLKTTVKQRKLLRHTVTSKHVNTRFLRHSRTEHLRTKVLCAFSLSRNVSGRVMLHHASEYVLRNPEKVFYPGRMVTVKVLG